MGRISLKTKNETVNHNTISAARLVEERAEKIFKDHFFIDYHRRYMELMENHKKKGGVKSWERKIRGWK